MRVEFNFNPDVVSVDTKRKFNETAREPVNEKARQLALAYYINAMIETGQAPDMASIARDAGVSTARLSQILDMSLLTPGIQEGLLNGSVTLGSHELRRLSGILDWDEQRPLTNGFD